MARATLFASEISAIFPETLAFTSARFVTLATNDSVALFPAESAPIEQTTRRFVRQHLRPPLERLVKLEPAGNVSVIFTPRSAAVPRFLSPTTNELRRYPLFILLAFRVWLSAKSGSGGETAIVLLAVARPPGPVAVSVTVYVPPFLKILVGEFSLELALPSPNYQRYEPALLDPFTKRTLRGARPALLLRVKDASGSGSATVTIAFASRLLDPSLATSVTL